MEMVKNDEIDIIDEQNRPILKQQVSLMSNKQQQKQGLGRNDEIMEDEAESVNIEVASPDAQRLSNAALAINNEKRFSEIEDQVKQFVRQNSLLKDAKNI